MGWGQTLLAVPLLWDRPLTTWGSILTGAIAFLLLLTAILQMTRRIALPVRHEVLGYTAIMIIVAHATIGFVARFILGL